MSNQDKELLAEILGDYQTGYIANPSARAEAKREKQEKALEALLGKLAVCQVCGSLINPNSGKPVQTS